MIKYAIIKYCDNASIAEFVCGESGERVIFGDIFEAEGWLRIFHEPGIAYQIFKETEC